MRKTSDISAAAAQDGQAKSSEDTNAQIARKLKALYTEVEQEPIPDMFLDLLERLEKVEQAGS